MCMCVCVNWALCQKEEPEEAPECEAAPEREEARPGLAKQQTQRDEHRKQIHNRHITCRHSISRISNGFCLIASVQ